MPFRTDPFPDGGTISVSDSGNNRIQQFSTNGSFVATLGSAGAGVGNFSSPEGIAYDSDGILYIVDKGNDRIVLAEGGFIETTTGTNGTVPGEFSSPSNIGIDERGIYIADTGNNRVQGFSPPGPHGFFTAAQSAVSFTITTNLNQPAAIAPLNNLTNQMFYVADTGNNRVILYSLALDDPTPTWTNMVGNVALGNLSSALSFFSMASVDDYQQAFSTLGSTNITSAIGQIGTLTPVYIINETAEYYFQETINGQTITFPVEFSKENGVWKILEF